MAISYKGHYSSFSHEPNLKIRVLVIAMNQATQFNADPDWDPQPWYNGGSVLPVCAPTTSLAAP
jgi:hypothetical protein